MKSYLLISVMLGSSSLCFAQTDDSATDSIPSNIYIDVIGRIFK